MESLIKCVGKTKCLDTGLHEEIHADIVVDASGFGSKSIEWLHEYNIEVQEERVRIDLFYATRMFKLKEDETLDCCNMLMSPSFPENPYGVLIQTIEDNRYFVTLVAMQMRKRHKRLMSFMILLKIYPF